MLRTQRLANLPSSCWRYRGRKEYYWSESWSPGTEEGCWAGATILKRGSTARDFSGSLVHTTCTEAGRDLEEIPQLLSAPSLWPPACAFLLLAPTRSQLEGVSLQGWEQQRGKGMALGWGLRGCQSTRKLIMSLPLRPDTVWQDEMCFSDLISQKSTRKYHFGKIIFKKYKTLFFLQHFFPFKFYLNPSFHLPPSNTEVFGSTSPPVGRLFSKTSSWELSELWEVFTQLSTNARSSKFP